MSEEQVAAVPPVPESSAPRKGGGPRRLRGVVVGAKADKTARVRIERLVEHKFYGKIMRRRRNLQAHDPENACKAGDRVVIEECPRVSKTKAWRVVERAEGPR